MNGRLCGEAWDAEREWLSKQNFTNTAEDAYTG